MTWEEFEKANPKDNVFFMGNKQPTDIDCPKCGKKVYVRTDIVLAS